MQYLFILASLDEILSRVGVAGFMVALWREVTLTEEQVRQFYHHHADDDYSPALQIIMTR